MTKKPRQKFFMDNNFSIENSQSTSFSKKYLRRKFNFLNPVTATVVNEYDKPKEPCTIIIPLLKNGANP